MIRTSPFRRSLLLAALAAGPMLFAGCGDGKNLKFAPVAGTVTANGNPLTAGTVTFQPDEAKGNTSKLAPSGMIDDKGHYKLITDNKDGAPVGWYKVGVSPFGMSAGGMGGMSATPPAGGPTDPSKNLTKGANINMKYQSPGTSGISIEVVENPATGAYDIKLTK